MRKRLILQCWCSIKFYKIICLGFKIQRDLFIMIEENWKFVLFWPILVGDVTKLILSCLISDERPDFGLSALYVNNLFFTVYFCGVFVLEIRGFVLQVYLKFSWKFALKTLYEPYRSQRPRWLVVEGFRELRSVYILTTTTTNESSFFLRIGGCYLVVDSNL